MFDTSQFDNILKRLKVQVAQPDDKGIPVNEGEQSNNERGAWELDAAMKATRPQGRYKKKERGKAVNAYSSKDLQGILGNKQGENLLTDQDPNSEMTLSKDSNLYISEPEDSKITEKSRQWWGQKYGFVSGGFLGAQSLNTKELITKDSITSCKRNSFGEDDQENLYKLVQDKATSGKQGLGIRDKPKKFAGCYWKGTKTSFNDCDELQVIVQDKAKTKLKKLSKQLLRQAPSQSLRLKKLKALLEAGSDGIFSKYCSKEEALLFLKQKLEGSKSFHVEGNRVNLVL